MTRREFLAAVAVGVPASGARYTSYVRYLGPESDEFACEREAQKIESELKRLLATKSLPLSTEFRGRSPLPASFKDVAEGVSEAVYDSPDLSAEVWRAGPAELDRQPGQSSSRHAFLHWPTTSCGMKLRATASIASDTGSKFGMRINLSNSYQ